MINFLVNTALLIPLLPAIVAGFKWKWMDNPQRYFSVMLWCIVLISFSGEAWVRTTGESNLPFFHVYILVEYLLLMQVFRLLFAGAVGKRFWAVLAIGFAVVWVINILAGEGWWGFPDYIRALEAIIILVVVSLWFRKMLREKKVLQPERTFPFWMFAGLLLFFSGNFLLFIFPKFLINTGKEVFEAIWIVNAILNILLYTLYTIALLWVRRTVK